MQIYLYVNFHPPSVKTKPNNNLHIIDAYRQSSVSAV